MLQEEGIAATNGKHAYLIIAHEDDATFRALLQLLDDVRNDIFVHMDAKNIAWDESNLELMVKKAGCFAVPRISVTWGGYSLIACELRLLEAAVAEGHYDFYHLLSGQDLPIKGQDEIHAFFDAHRGIEFVRYQSEPIDCLARVYGHRLWNKYGCSRSQKVLMRLDALWSKAEHVICHRTYEFEFRKGDQWFSIDDMFARYVLSKKDWVERTFCYSYLADEIFLHTILWNSPFRENVYRRELDDDCSAFQRLIDWDRGTPYCFSLKDLNELRDSHFMFARKFDCKKDPGIIDAVVSMVQSE